MSDNNTLEKNIHISHKKISRKKLVVIVIIISTVLILGAAGTWWWYNNLSSNKNQNVSGQKISTSLIDYNSELWGQALNQADADYQAAQK